MASERQCNKIRKQDQQEKAALGHKVKIHQFFSFTIIQCFIRMCDIP